ncbi:homogentisate 1,2-dioxygenase, partial [Rhizobium ruizarguesonis]
MLRWYQGGRNVCSATSQRGGKFYVTDIGHSPLDVVAWHGNYAPFKYDLRTFS